MEEEEGKEDEEEAAVAKMKYLGQNLNKSYQSLGLSIFLIEHAS